MKNHGSSSTHPKSGNQPQGRLRCAPIAATSGQRSVPSFCSSCAIIVALGTPRPVSTVRKPVFESPNRAASARSDRLSMSGTASRRRNTIWRLYSASTGEPGRKGEVGQVPPATVKVAGLTFGAFGMGLSLRFRAAKNALRNRGYALVVKWSIIRPSVVRQLRTAQPRLLRPFRRQAPPCTSDQLSSAVSL